MRTGWLLLLLLFVVSSQSVDCQPTTGNGTRDEDTDFQSTTPGTHDDDLATARTRDEDETTPGSRDDDLATPGTRDDDLATAGTRDDYFGIQSTTATTRDDVEHPTKQQRDIETILENQKLLLENQRQQFQTVLRNQQKIFNILQQHQTILDRLGRSSFLTTFAVQHMILASSSLSGAAGNGGQV